MPVFGVAYSQAILDLPAIFGRTAPTILEIGFGMGQSTAAMAAENPALDFLGVEVHTPGVGALLKRVEAQGLSNVRVIEHDVKEVIAHQIPDECLTGIHVFFPDPWPKARHHKRRLIRQAFVEKLVMKLCPGGYLHLATDWPDYAEQMADAVASAGGLHRVPDGFSPLSPAAVQAGAQPLQSRGPAQTRTRPVTRFEQRGLELGHPIADIVAVKAYTASGTSCRHSAPDP